MAVAQKKWWVRNRGAQAPEPDEQPVDLENLTKPELAALAEAKGLDPAGTKADLVERLGDG